MLTLYTDLALLSLNKPVDLLIPFIGIPEYDKDKNNVISGRFNKFFAQGKQYIALTENVQEADAALLPVYYPDRGDTTSFDAAIANLVAQASNAGKKIIVFTGHDVQDVTVNIPNAVIFNGAINKSSQQAHTFSWPHFFEDYLGKYYNTTVPERQKQAMPVIGFCGYVPPFGVKFGKEKIISILKLLANYAGYMQKHPEKSSHSYRARAIMGLRRSRKIRTNFRIKSNFAFGPSGLNTGVKTESNDDFRRNFVRNIVESDYTLCVRGIGNNSIRFFETLCCGRIPVFVNTNSVLPFDHLINWKELCVWVEEKDIDRIGEKVAEFHNKISEEDFIALQHQLRQIWEEYLSPLGFFRNIHLFLS
jgi:hypothetical protein